MRKVKKVKGVDAFNRPYTFYEILNDTTKPRTEDGETGNEIKTDSIEHDNKDVAVHRPLRSRGWQNFGETL